MAPSTMETRTTAKSVNMTNDNQDVSIEVTSRHHHVSDETRAYATDKASKLLRFHNRVSRIQIVLDKHKEDRTVEMIVHVDSGHTFVAKETAGGFRSAFDPLVAKMERQLKKDNQKRKHHKGEEGLKDRLSPEQEPRGDTEETYDDVVRRNLDS